MIRNEEVWKLPYRNMDTRKEPWMAREIICRKRVCIPKILWFFGAQHRPQKPIKNSYHKLELNQVSQIIRNVTILIAYLCTREEREKIILLNQRKLP